MMINTKGTNSSVPATPARVRLVANSDVTAAATIPRGAIHDKKSFSRHESGEFMVLTKMFRGRTMNMTTATKSRLCHDSAAKNDASSMLAARTIKRSEMKSKLKSSLNVKISPILGARRFAQTPLPS